MFSNLFWGGRGGGDEGASPSPPGTDGLDGTDRQSKPHRGRDTDGRDIMRKTYLKNKKSTKRHNISLCFVFVVKALFVIVFVFAVKNHMFICIL